MAEPPGFHFYLSFYYVYYLQLQSQLHQTSRCCDIKIMGLFEFWLYSGLLTGTLTIFYGKALSDFVTGRTFPHPLSTCTLA